MNKRQEENSYLALFYLVLMSNLTKLSCVPITLSWFLGKDHLIS